MIRNGKKSNTLFMIYRISYRKRRTVSKIMTQLLSDYMLIPSQANENQ